MEKTIDAIIKDYTKTVQLVGSERFLIGLLKTISRCDFAIKLSDEKLIAYITLAKRNVNEKYSMLNLLITVCPEANLIKMIKLICEKLEERGDNLVDELIERTVF